MSLFEFDWAAVVFTRSPLRAKTKAISCVITVQVLIKKVRDERDFRNCGLAV